MGSAPVYINLAVFLMQLPTLPAVVQQGLHDAFYCEDKDNTGVLPLYKIMQVLKRKSYDGLGLTSYHIGIILSSVAHEDHNQVSLLVLHQTHHLLGRLKIVHIDRRFFMPMLLVK